MLQVDRYVSDDGRWQKLPPAFSCGLQVVLPVAQERRHLRQRRRRLVHEQACPEAGPSIAEPDASAKGEAIDRETLYEPRARVGNRESNRVSVELDYSS